MIFNMRKQAFLLAVLCGLLCVQGVSAQTFVRYVTPRDLNSEVLYTDAVLPSVILPKGVSRVENNPELQAAAFELADVMSDPDRKLLRVYVCGSASPEGLWQDNVALSEARTDAAVRYLRHVTGIPASMIHVHSLNEDWDRLYELVEESEIPYRDDVLEIISTKKWGERKLALQRLGDGKVWDILLKDFFPKMRCVRVAIYCQWDPSRPYMTAVSGQEEVESSKETSESLMETSEFPVETEDLVAESVETVAEPDSIPVTEKEPVKDVILPSQQKAENIIYIRDTVYVVKETVYLPASVRQDQQASNYYGQYKQPRTPVYHDTPWMMGFKTNLLADAMVIPSLGMEIQLAERMSLDLQGWYTGTNVFCKDDRNTNVYGFTPELRWWTGGSAMQKGTFVGVHARMAWYTLQWRDGLLYQNGKDGEHAGDAGNAAPAWSIGFTYGYSLSLDRKDRWGLELLLGLGYGQYSQNVGEINPEDQKWYIKEHQKLTHIGITRASVNLTYRFSVRKVKPEYYNNK